MENAEQPAAAKPCTAERVPQTPAARFDVQHRTEHPEERDEHSNQGLCGKPKGKDSRGLHTGRRSKQALNTDKALEDGRIVQTQSKKQRTPPGLPDGVQESAMTYFPSEKYHRQRRLNCCVRDGNRCFPSLMYTDNPTRRPFGQPAGLRHLRVANRNARIWFIEATSCEHCSATKSCSRSNLTLPANRNGMWLVVELRPLVPLSSRHYCPYTCGLSTWWSTRGLTSFD